MGRSDDSSGGPRRYILGGFAPVNLGTQNTVGTANITATSAVLLQGNNERTWAYISQSTDADVWIHFGAAALTSAGILLRLNGSLQIDASNMCHQTITAISNTTTASVVYFSEGTE